MSDSKWLLHVWVSRWLFGWIFSGLAALEDLRIRYESLYRVFEFSAVALFGWLSWHKLNAVFEVPPARFEQVFIALHFALSILVGLFLSVFFRGFLPFLYYAPHAVAMRTMGLVSASTAPGAGQKELRKYVSLQPQDARVRVICISGRYLFRESRIAGKDPPLLSAAERGLVDVVMPRADLNNQTIRERFNTYLPGHRKSLYPHGIDGLVREIEEGQTYLKEVNASNSVVEHDMLCMWRVIVLPTHCIIQNYFPNTTGDESDNAPVFVFQNLGAHSYSYYRSFELMFEMLERLGKHQKTKH